MSPNPDFGPGTPEDPLPQYLTEEEGADLAGTGESNAAALTDHDEDAGAHVAAAFASATDIDDAVTAHTEESDPHAVYLTSAEGDTKVTDHDQDVAPHTEAGFASSDLIDTAIDDHKADPDPHTDYTTSTELDTAVTAHTADTTSVHGITNTAVLETTTGTSTAITSHSGDTDPHGDRAYADSVATGLDIKASVVAATTANITLSGAQTIDGVAVVAGNRVLVKNQSTTKNNGIYVASNSTWARSTDADTTGELTTGAFTYVEGGTANATSSWVCNSAGTLETDPVVFTTFSSAGAVGAGAGLLKTGSTIDLVSGGGLTVAADSVTVASSHGGSTHAATQAAAEATAATALAAHVVVDENAGPDFVVSFDGTNYMAKRMSDLTIPYTSNTSLHNVLNSAMEEFDDGNGNSASGCHIKLTSPANRIMTTTAAIRMHNGVRLEGPGASCTILASGTWGGTLAAPTPVINANNVQRMSIENVTVECAGLAGSTGIWSTSGVGDGPNFIKQCWIRNPRISGIQIGYSGNFDFSQSIYLENNEVLATDGTGTGIAGGGTLPSNPGAVMGVAFFNGDCHYLAGNNVKINAATGYPMYIEVGSVHVVGESHFANNSNTCTNGLITVTKGGNNRFEGIYFDNINQGPAIDLSATAGTVHRQLISGNWFHGTADTGTPAAIIKVNNSTNGNYGHVITNNTAEAGANSATHSFKAIVEITNASGKHAENTLIVANNSIEYCKNFVIVGGVASSVAVGGSMNIIDAGGPGSPSVTVGP